jgi:hypothetical protein
MRKALFLPLAAFLTIAAPATAGAGTAVKGVVIAKLPHQGELVVAAANGSATTLRAPSLPAVGTVVRASVFKLSDGTSAASHLTIVRHVRHAAFKGILVKTVAGTSFFAVGRSVVAVRMPTRSISSARDTAPQPGESAEIEVTITAGGTLDEDSVTPEHENDAARVTLHVTIAAVTPATATTPGSLTLTIGTQTLVIPLPAGTVLPSAFVANATVDLTIKFEQPGVGEDNSGPGRNDRDDDDATTTMSTTTTTIPAAGSTTTTAATTTTQSNHDGDGHGHGGHDGGGGGGDD